MTHNSSPWFESMRDELFMAMRERRQAERKWRNTKLTIFKELYRQAKHTVSKLVHTARCDDINVTWLKILSSTKSLFPWEVLLGSVSSVRLLRILRWTKPSFEPRAVATSVLVQKLFIQCVFLCTALTEHYVFVTLCFVLLPHRRWCVMVCVIRCLLSVFL